MSVDIRGAEAGTFKTATALYAAHDGEWIEVPLGGGGGDPNEWTRPADWLPMNVGVGEQKIQCLCQIGPAGSPETQRVITVMAAGNYTVDWGDGTAPQNVNSNTLASHLYNPANLTGTLTSDGWLQALITITPQTGNLITLSLSNAYYAAKTYRSPVVEIVVGPSTITTFTLGSTCPVLHRVEFKSKLTLASGSALFSDSRYLREIVGEIAITGTTVANMFSGCSKLTKFPTITLSPSVVTATSMFQNCSSMVESPPFACSQIQNWSAAYINCSMLLRLFPGFSTAAATNMQTMFQSCVMLEELPLLETALVTTMSSMFNGCTSLRKVSFTNTALVTNVASMFASNYCLESLTGLDWSAVTPVASLNNTFGATYKLSKLEFLPDKGPKFSFTVQALLDAAGLNALYTSLPTVSGQTLTVTNMPGTLGDDPSIATAKGWTVTGS